MAKTVVNKIEVKFTNLDDLLKKSAKDLAKDIQNAAPKDSGEYASGITYKKVGKDDYKIFNDGERFGLGHILEFGTTKQKAQPHYRPTFEKHKPKILKHLEKIKLEIE